MNLPLVSCIVPVFNGAAFLRAALDSIFGQTWRSIEVIVVDDGSTDPTPDVVAAYPKPVSYYRQANAGAPSARNNGIVRSRGAYIAFLDADDLWHAEKLERQVSRLLREPDASYAVTLGQNVWMDGLQHLEDRHREHPRMKPLPAYITGALMARRSAFESAGPFNGSLRHADSADWFIKAARQGLRGLLIPEVLYFHRLHERNVSRVLAGECADEFALVLKAKLERERNVAAAARP